jgi:hypothetical protein
MIRPERKLTREYIEREALQVLVKFYSSDIKLPIDPELIGNHFGLSWDWDEIVDPEPNSTRKILAGLYPRKKLVVMNELHAELFTSNLGLERFTKAHEVGHWILHIDHAAIDHPTLFEMDTEEDDPKETILCRAGDDAWIEWQADHFAACLLMPKDKFIETAMTYTLGTRETQRELATLFGVSVTALVNRLRQFDLTHMTFEGEVVRSQSEKAGQMRFQ